MKTTAAQSMPNLTGTMIDRYHELKEVLGSGTYGVVYKALDIRTAADPTPTYRAVKIMRKTGRKKFEITNIQREIALHAHVGSARGIVRMHDAFDDANYFYIVLDFVPGGDLFTQICEHKAYEGVGGEARARSAFVSLIDAVIACHKLGIAHRDLKPENVLASEDGSELYLADFGLATRRITVSENGCGTGVYMSPECIGEMTGKQPFCPRSSDVWSLGVIFINMLTGRNPWARAVLSDDGFAMFVDDPTYIGECLPLAPGAARLIRRMLSLDPRQRPALPELRAAVLSLPTLSRAPKPPKTVKVSKGALRAAPPAGAPKALAARRPTPHEPRVPRGLARLHKRGADSDATAVDSSSSAQADAAPATPRAPAAPAFADDMKTPKPKQGAWAAAPASSASGSDSDAASLETARSSTAVGTPPASLGGGSVATALSSGSEWDAASERPLSPAKIISDYRKGTGEYDRKKGPTAMMLMALHKLGMRRGAMF